MITKERRNVQAGAVLFILAPIIFLVLEAIVAEAWIYPEYNYLFNHVSDLGVPVRTVYNGRLIISPLHDLMNFGFVASAVIFVTAYFLVTHMVPGKRKRACTFLTILYGIGMILVGLFPRYDWWGDDFHGFGATTALLSGNVALVVYGLLFRQLLHKKWHMLISVLFGLVGLTSVIVYYVDSDSYLRGLFERIGIWPMMAWAIITGLLLLYTSKKTRIAHFSYKESI